jgi:hypothetical protein
MANTLQGRIFWIAMGMMIMSCRKNEISVTVENLSVSSSLQLHCIEPDGNNLLIAGGERFYQAALFRYEQHALTPVSLPQATAAKALLGLSVSGEGRAIACGYDGSFYLRDSTSGEWKFIQSPLWKEWRDIQFISNDSALVIGRSAWKEGYMMRVDKNLIGFGSITEVENFSFSKLYIRSDGQLHRCGYGAMQYADRNGLQWEFSDAKNDNFSAQYWKNATEGLAVGYEGSILRTTDGGLRWNTLRNANNAVFKRLHILGIHGIGEQVVLVGEKGLVMISNNLGSAWQTLKPFTQADLHDVYLLNTHEALVVGSEGACFKIAF